MGRRVEAVLWALVLVTALALFWRFDRGQFIYGVDGQPALTDFADLWAAAIRAAQGNAALAYNYDAHVAFQSAVVGQRSELPYPYPPHFFFVLIPFGLMPYLGAMLSFLGASAAVYIAALRLIVRSTSLAIAMGLAMGGGYFALLYGQLGYFTGALLVGGLALLPRYPTLAGILFGCLTMKPHLGVVLFFTLVLGKEWKAFRTAAITTVVLAGASEVVFGPGIWLAYFPAVRLQSSILVSGAIWQHGASVFALAYPALGTSEAMLLHIISAVAAGVCFAWIWYRRPSHDLRAAGILATTLLISPYMMTYDAVILTGAAAFLLKGANSAPEKALIILAFVLPAMKWLSFGLGVPLGSWIMLYVIIRRSLQPGEVCAGTGVLPPTAAQA